MPVVVKETVFKVAADTVTAVLKLKITLLELPAFKFAAATVDVLASTIVGGVTTPGVVMTISSNPTPPLSTPSVKKITCPGTVEFVLLTVKVN